MWNAQNYSRKGTIEYQMRKNLVAAVALIAAASSVSAQTNAAPVEQPGGAYYEFLMGLHLESQGDSAGAAAAYQRGERLDPQSAEIPAALAELYARTPNRAADAIAAAERAVKANAANPEANWILGTLYARMSEMPTTRDADRRSYTQRAIAGLEKANRNAHAGVPMMLGRLYLADKQHDKAIALLEPFVAEQPEQVEAVALLAEAYQTIGRDADAVRLLEQSVEGSPELYGALGQVYQDSGRWQDAAKAYQGAVEERPQSLPLRTQWATALLNAGDARRAREVLEEGSAGSSRSARALYLLSEAQRRTRDYAAAEVTARRLIDARRPGPGRAAPAGADFPGPGRASESGCRSRADRDPAPSCGGCRRSDERCLSLHVFRSRIGLRSAAAVRQIDCAADSGAGSVADRSARRHAARAIAAGGRQGR